VTLWLYVSSGTVSFKLGPTGRFVEHYFELEPWKLAGSPARGQCELVNTRWLVSRY
jgi:hypothetical protein